MSRSETSASATVPEFQPRQGRESDAFYDPRQSATAEDVGAWNRFAFQSVRGMLKCLATLLGINGLYRFGKWFGTLEWLVNYKRRRRFGDSLKRVFGDPLSPAKRRRDTRAHFQMTRCDKVFYLIFDMLPREEVMKRFCIENRYLFDEGLARGKGVYSALSHHGAHHVNGLCMGLLGYKVGAVRDRKESALRKFIQRKYDAKYPEFQKARVLFADSYPRDVYRCLKENYGLGSALDVNRPREPHQKTATVTIFGEERNFLTGTLQIALRCRSTILQSFVISEPNFHYRLQFLGPLVPPGVSDESPEALGQVMQTYARNIETYVRQYPSHISRV